MKDIVDILIIIGGVTVIGLLVWAIIAFWGSAWNALMSGDFFGWWIDNAIAETLADSIGPVMGAVGEAIGDLFDDTSGDF